jgi:hypothetical protein
MRSSTLPGYVDPLHPAVFRETYIMPHNNGYRERYGKKRDLKNGYF